MDEADTALVVEAMYQIAADPGGWPQLFEILEDKAGQDLPPEEAVRGLAHSMTIARLVQRPGEGGPQPPRPASQIGWILLNRAGEVIAFNPSAHAICLGGLASIQTGDRLSFVDPDNALVLADALTQARDADQGQVILKFERTGEAGPCFAYVAQAALVPPAMFDDGTIPPADTLVLVFPAPEETGRMWSTLRESFGLTPAEIRLAALLREGKTLKDAADELSVSINTVRNQLRAVFDKLGLKRQSDLIRALTELSQVSGALGDLSPGQAGATPEVRFVTLPDRRRLAYREYGVPKGRNLLLFHEGLGSSLLPEGAQVLAAQLGLRVISAERPGFGQSDPHPDYSFDAVAEDMAELCDQLGLTDIRIAAILSGAASALTTGIHLGSRVKSILLCSGRPPRPTSKATTLMTRFRARLEAHPWVLDTFYTILRIRLSAGLIEGMIRTATTHSPGDRALLKDSPWMVNYMAAYVSECLARTAKGSTDEIRAFQRGGNLTPVALAAPLTVWHGADDQFAPLSDLQEFLGEKPYDLKVFPGVGHLLAVKVWDQILRHAAA